MTQRRVKRTEILRPVQAQPRLGLSFVSCMIALRVRHGGLTGHLNTLWPLAPGYSLLRPLRRPEKQVPCCDGYGLNDDSNGAVSM
jgi:hypothetical protein